MSEERAVAKERRERTKRIFSDPNLLDTICSHVANGGTAIELAEIWDIRWGDIANWLHSDKEREKRYIAALNDRGEWGVERILQELRNIGLADPRQMFDDKGNLKPPHEWPTSIARSVAGVETFEEFKGRGDARTFIGYTKKIKFWDKGRALEMLGKNLSMFVDRVKHEGTVTLAELVAGSRGEEEK